MNEGDRRVTGGVDAHADSHHAAVLDERGVLLGSRSFAVSVGGYRELLAWLGSFGEVERVGVESTGSYAAGLTRYLLAEGIAVVEVNQPHPHTRRRRGKNGRDRRRAGGPSRPRPPQAGPPEADDGIVESIRQLRVARESAVRSRSAAMLQLGGLILTAPGELREQLTAAKTPKGKAGLCSATTSGVARFATAETDFYGAVGFATVSHQRLSGGGATHPLIPPTEAKPRRNRDGLRWVGAGPGDR